MNFLGSSIGAAREVWGARGKPIADGLQGSGGDDGGAIGDGVIGKTVFGIADDNLLLEVDAEPFGGAFVVLRKSEGARRNLAAIAGDRQSDAAKLWRIGCADEVDGGSALAVDPLAVDGIESPGAIESESTGRADAGLCDGGRVERFYGVKANVGEDGLRGRH